MTDLTHSGVRSFSNFGNISLYLFKKTIIYLGRPRIVINEENSLNVMSDVVENQKRSVQLGFEQLE